MKDPAQAEISKFENLAIKRYYGDSGIVDLVICLAALSISLMVYFGYLFLLVVYFLVLFGFGLAHNLLVKPRLGYAEFHKLHSKKNQLAFGIYTFIFMIMGGLLYLLLHKFFPYPEKKIADIMAWIPHITFWFGVSVLGIIRYRIFHLLIYLLALLILIILGFWIKLSHMLLWGGILISCIALVTGFAKLMIFMKHYPILKVENE